MFKYFANFPNKVESVYNLVEPEQVDPNSDNIKYNKKTRYRSVHSAMVRDEVDKNKAWPSKTMGVPRLSVEAPDMFLKKQSKRPISIRPKTVSCSTLLPRTKSCQTGENDCGTSEKTREERDIKVNSKEEKLIIDSADSSLSTKIMPTYTRVCTTAKRPPIPDPNLGVDIVVRGMKDFIKSNALTAINTQPAKPKEPMLYVDTPNGDTKEWQNSGLAPHYVNKKKFAHVPVYITVRKKEFLDQLKKSQEEERAKASNPNVHILDKEEKEAMINKLKQNWDQIFSFYQRLPLMIDTIGKIKRKTGMEAQLKKLETDIQLLERHDSIYVSDIAPCSYYAFSGNRK